MTTTQLVDGLGGGMGSHYVAATNQLYFVEADGKVSFLDLVRSLDEVVSNGTAVLPPDTGLDLITGETGPTGNLRWDAKQVLGALGPSVFSYLGPVDYDAVTTTTLQSLVYDEVDLIGEGKGGQLVYGAVFAVSNSNRVPTNDWDYAKIQVLGPGETLKVQWEAYRLNGAYHVLATGYEQPTDIVVAADGLHAYVTEATGNLLRVDLGYPKRFAATVLASGLAQPQQLALDEARGQAYVVESNGERSRLVRIDLTSRARAVVAANLINAAGVVVSGDGRTAYVSQQTGGRASICRVRLGDGHREDLPVTIAAPGSLTWGSGGESQILTTDLQTNEVLAIDLTCAPVAVRPQAGVSRRPASVAVLAPEIALVCCAEVIVRVDLTASAYNASGYMLLGIGHVPSDNVVEGYATTDPGYFFQALHSPFGGTLPIMVNHQGAYQAGGRYYQVLVDGVVQTRDWSDELWVTSRQSVVTPARRSGSFFQVRPPTERWHHPWLGYFLDTTPFPDGRHTIEVRVFAYADAGAPILAWSDLVVVLDNRLPRAEIKEIVYLDPTNADPERQRQVVSTCGIVQGTSDEFEFVIDARDPGGQHLRGWSMGVLWGDNRSGFVDDDAYERGHVTGPPHAWAGLTGTVPRRWRAGVPGDPTSLKCAHTFYLHVWDRVIDGWNYVHFAGYTKSITLLLSPPQVITDGTGG